MLVREETISNPFFLLRNLTTVGIDADNEVLGIVHEVLDDWKSWKAPIPPREHTALYARIGTLYLDARAQRELVIALAQTYLQADPPINLAYLPHVGRLHSLWAAKSAQPELLATSLAAHSEDLPSWWEEKSALMDSNSQVWRDGQARQAALSADRARLRGLLVWVMGELKLLESEED